ncbi:hypothetical protein ACF3NG_07655 [Aerococcaceae bacterium WGS1372]
MNNNQKNKGIRLLFLLVILLSANVTVTAIGESQSTDYTDEIRWYGVYDNYSQLSLDEINQHFEQIIKEGSTDHQQEDIIELFGEPSDCYMTGASEYLIYYSMNDLESVILYFHFFSEKKAEEISKTTAENSTDDTRASEEELSETDLYLSEVNKLVLNQSNFTPLKMSVEEVKEWQDSQEDDRRIKTRDELIDHIGEPSEIIYNFKQDKWTYTWYRNNKNVDGLTYLSAEVDSANNIQLISIMNEVDTEDEE